MTTTQPEAQTAWEQFQADMRSLGDELRRHYQTASAEEPDLRAPLHELGQAADEVLEGAWTGNPRS